MSPPVAASTSALPATHSAAHPPEAGEVLSTVAVATRMSTTGSTGAELASPSSVLPVVKGGTPAAVEAWGAPYWGSGAGVLVWGRRTTCCRVELVPGTPWRSPIGALRAPRRSTNA
ncbi:hypothetical protein [Microbacterium hydrocarbonoxydans]|uniref:hypothetical protein n=1 Tax=Microbacterium hydrocarbonoxydans TaxID=273678 RepID=UPI003D97EE8A